MRFLPFTEPMTTLTDMFCIIEKNTFPNNASVIGDDLRLSLSTAYDININMLDTHKFKLNTVSAHQTNIYCSRDCYIYEGTDDQLLEIKFNTKMYGSYPEGIFLGIVSNSLRTMNRNTDVDTVREIFDDLQHIAKTFVTEMYELDHRDATAYADYLRSVMWAFPIYYLKKYHEMDLDDIPADDLYINNGYIAKDNVVLYNYIKDNVKLYNYIKDNLSGFMKACGSFDYSKFYRWLHDSGLVI